MTTNTKSAESIASELEAEANRLLEVAQILKGGPVKGVTGFARSKPKKKPGRKK